MKLILMGYPGSEVVDKISAYLRYKYLPNWETFRLCYRGEIDGWAKYAANYLKQWDDKYIIFSLDDYLISEPMNIDEFNSLLGGMKDAVLAKLCACSDEDNESYPVTTQYTIWNREYLISLLEQVKTPWEFEIEGSKIFKASGHKALFGSALKYNTNSSLSKRWDGIDFKGLSEEDLKEIKTL